MSVLLAANVMDLQVPTDSQSSSSNSSFEDGKIYYPPEVLEKICAAIAQHSVSLDLSGSDLCDLPAELFEATDLQTLNLSNNCLKALSPKIAHLSNLHVLDISNNYVNNLPFTIGNLKELNCLRVSGNPLINMPKDIACTKDCKKTLGYYKDLQRATTCWGDVKMVFLGDTNAGKSSLMASLINHRKKKLFGTLKRKSCNMLCLKTDSVEVVPYPNKSFSFGIWDFGGQNCYYDLVDVFLSDRTCYVVTFNLTPGAKTDHNLQYWIDLVKTKKNAPIILAGTHMEFLSKDECHTIHQQMKQNYPNYPFFMVNNKNYKGVQELGRFLKKVTKEIILKEQVPAKFVCIKEWLSDKKLNGERFLTHPQFTEMMRDAGSIDVQACLKYLHDCGTILYIENEDASQSLLVLDPSYLAEAWIALCTSKQLLHDDCISSTELAQLWNHSHFSEETHQHLLSTYRAFDKIRIDDAGYITVKTK